MHLTVKSQLVFSTRKFKKFPASQSHIWLFNRKNVHQKIAISNAHGQYMSTSTKKQTDGIFAELRNVEKLSSNKIPAQEGTSGPSVCYSSKNQ